MRKLTFVLAILAGLFPGAVARAQITTWSNSGEDGPHPIENHFTLFGSLALPVGDFADTRSDRAGFAMPGAGIGVDAVSVYRTGIEVGVLVLADRNATDSGQMTAAFNRAIWAVLPTAGGFELTASDWISVWALGKLGFSGPEHDGVQTFADLYVGGVYARTPRVDVLYLPSGESAAGRSEGWVGQAGGIGAGVRLHRRVTFGLLWLAGSLSGSDGSPVPISTVQASLGCLLNR